MPFIDPRAYENTGNIAIEAPKEEEYQPPGGLPRYDDTIGDEYWPHPKFSQYRADRKGKIQNTAGRRVKDFQRVESTIIIRDEKAWGTLE